MRDNLGRTPLDVAREHGPFEDVEVEFDPKAQLRKQLAKVIEENKLLREEVSLVDEKRVLLEEEADTLRAQVADLLRVADIGHQE